MHTNIYRTCITKLQLGEGRLVFLSVTNCVDPRITRFFLKFYNKIKIIMIGAYLTSRGKLNAYSGLKHVNVMSI